MQYQTFDNELKPSLMYTYMYPYVYLYLYLYMYIHMYTVYVDVHVDVYQQDQALKPWGAPSPFNASEYKTPGPSEA